MLLSFHARCWSAAAPPSWLSPSPDPARSPGQAAWLLRLYFRAADWSFPCHRSGFFFNSLSASQISKDGLLLCLLWKKMHCRKLFLIKVNKVSLFLFFFSSPLSCRG